MNDLIICKPQAQSPGQKLSQRLLTGAFWLLFLYLLRPVFILFAWVVGISIFTEVMIDGEGGYDLIFMLRWYGLIVGILAFLLETWAIYNLLRFRGKERRRTLLPVAAGETAAFFGIKEMDLLLWRNARCLQIRHNAEGEVVAGEIFESQPCSAVEYRLSAASNPLQSSA